MKVAALFSGLMQAKQQHDFLCFKGGCLGLKQVEVDKKQISKILCPTIIICNETILGCLETVWAAKPLTCKTRSPNLLFMWFA